MNGSVALIEADAQFAGLYMDFFVQAFQQDLIRDAFVEPYALR